VLFKTKAIKEIILKKSNLLAIQNTWYTWWK